MGRSVRLFEIIQILKRSKRPISARSIAEALEVSDRTIYRDVVELQGMRVPIEGEAGVGYVMHQGFELPPLMFTPDEVEAIVVGLAMIGRTGDVGLQKAATRVSHKIESVLPESSEARMGDNHIQVSQWNTVPATNVEYEAVREAIRAERKLVIRYSDANAAITARTICPIALIYYIDSVILAAWCELREDFRHFRLDRVFECSSTEASFQTKGAKLRQDWREGRLLFSTVPNLEAGDKISR